MDGEGVEVAAKPRTIWEALQALANGRVLRLQHVDMRGIMGAARASGLDPEIVVVDFGGDSFAGVRNKTLTRQIVERNAANG